MDSLQLLNRHPGPDSIETEGLVVSDVFTDGTLKKGSPAEYLAGEFLRRLTVDQKIGFFGGAFVLAASRGNDSTAAAFLENLRRHLEHYVGPFRSASDSGMRFLNIVEQAYWTLPLYHWTYGGVFDEPKLVNNLRKTKSMTYQCVAWIWSGYDGVTNNRAFSFLCDVCSADAVIKKATLFAKEAKQRENSRHERRPEFYFELPSDDLNSALTAIRRVTEAHGPLDDSENVRTWLKKPNLPEPVRRLLSHAFVNAGGAIT